MMRAVARRGIHLLILAIDGLDQGVDLSGGELGLLEG